MSTMIAEPESKQTSTDQYVQAVNGVSARQTETAHEVNDPSAPSVTPTSWIASHATAAFLFGFLLIMFVGDRLLDAARIPFIYGSLNRCGRSWDAFAHAQRTPDVVYLGCSYEHFGIRPTVVDHCVQELTNAPTFSMNLGAVGTSTYTEYLLIRRMVDHRLLPRLVYIGVSPRTTVLEGYPGVARAIRAMGDWRDLPIAARADEPMLGEAVCASLFASYRHWHDVRLAAEYLLDGKSLDGNTREQSDARGWAQWLGSRTEQDDELEALQPEPGPSLGVALDNPNPAALFDAVRLLRQAGVKVRFVEMPQRDRLRAPIHPRKNITYAAFIEAAAEKLNVPIVRAPDGLIDEAHFLDLTHLDADGASAFSRWLANDVAATLYGQDQPQPPDSAGRVRLVTASPQPDR